MEEPANTQTHGAGDGIESDGVNGSMSTRKPQNHGNAVLVAERRLDRARGELREAMERLGALRRQATSGGNDRDALDRAVIECRDAEKKVQTARRNLERRRTVAFGDAVAERSSTKGTPPGDVTTSSVGPIAGPDAADAAEAPPEPLEVTPRLLFARWLVQNGRLSDQRRD